MKGKFITFEGPDGSGKSTILKIVSERLEKEGVAHLLTREPGGTEISEKIRSLILSTENSAMTSRTEALLYSASRAQLVEEFIKPNVELGKLVISDRFVLSSLAYQGVARGLGVEKISEINNFATGGFKPDAILFFMVDPTTVIERKRANFTPDRLESEENAFHQKVYEGYMQALENTGGENVELVDATKSIDEVAEAAYRIVKKYVEE